MMKRRALHLLRNIGIVAHIDAGKTTLTERILYFTGKSHKIGETHQGNSQMDTLKPEIEKGITISAAATQTEWQVNGQTHRINIIDTPGHVDFTIEVERSLRVLDGMVMLFDAVAGVEPQSETVWRQSQRYAVPAIAYVNKMDRPGSDFFTVIQQMKDQLGANAWPIQLPIIKDNAFVGVVDLLSREALVWSKETGQAQSTAIPAELLESVEFHRNALLEELASTDEALLDRYLDQSNSIREEEWQASLRSAVVQRSMVPVLAGAAYKNIAVQPLLDAIGLYLPSPLDTPSTEGLDPGNQQSIERAVDPEAPFAGLVFKVILDEQNRRLSFFRIYSGRLAAGDSILNVRTGKKERISQLYQMHANKRTELQEAFAGDIVASLSLKQTRTGDTIADMKAPILLESLYVPKPVMGVAIEVVKTAQLDKLGLALARLAEEDPTFKVAHNQETGQTIIQGMGELHLEIVLDKLQHDFGVAVNIGQPQVSYFERLQETGRQWGRLKKQSGGPGLFAEMDVELGPADPAFLADPSNGRLQFIDKVVGGNIPKSLIPFVEKGFRTAMESGPLAGHPLESLKVTLWDGKTHSKDSKPLAFELCAQNTYREMARDLAPQLLEPLMQVEVQTPEPYLGTVIGDLNRRRGLIKGQRLEHGRIVVHAEVPLVEMFGYVSHLRSSTAGRGTFNMQLRGYTAVNKLATHQA
ncbi:MAG: elongation factor G [Saprospiraceae bacterium]|nr:elongation factor G [Saprospiraceae bacterium]